MELENRYAVIKKTDLEKALDILGPEYTDHIKKIIDTTESVRKERNKEPLSCVVIEKDWPEYEPVLKAIEKRVKERNKQ